MVLENGDERERGTGEERKVMIAMLIEELLLPIKRREEKVKVVVNTQMMLSMATMLERIEWQQGL